MNSSDKNGQFNSISVLLIEWERASDILHFEFPIFFLNNFGR